MRKFWLAGAVLAISACSGGGNNDANNSGATDNLMVDQNMTADQNMISDPNMAMDQVNAAEANGSVDANTAAAMKQDANTHDHDTNLANGI